MEETTLDTIQQEPVSISKERDVVGDTAPQERASISKKLEEDAIGDTSPQESIWTGEWVEERVIVDTVSITDNMGREGSL